MSVHHWKTFIEVYDFQSQYGLDLDGWKIRGPQPQGYYMEQMVDGEWTRFTEDDYLEMVMV